MFNFGFSILLNSLSFVVILGTTRFFLKANGTFEDVGILGMAMRLSLFVGALLISPFTLAWLPFVKTQMNKIDFHQTMNSTFRIFSWVGLLFCLALELILRDLFYIINNTEYLASLPYVLPFSIAYFMQGIYFIFAAGIFISSNNRQYRIIGIISIMVNLILYTVLRNYITIDLVAFITVFSFLTIMILAYFYGNKVLNIRVLGLNNVIIYLSYTFLLFLSRKVVINLDFSYAIFFLKIFMLILLFGSHVILEKKILIKNG
jgi:O-antigen/teichoic acid export membrane protein